MTGLGAAAASGGPTLRVDPGEGWPAPAVHLPRLLRPAVLARLGDLAGVTVAPSVLAACTQPAFFLRPCDVVASGAVCKHEPPSPAVVPGSGAGPGPSMPAWASLAPVCLLSAVCALQPDTVHHVVPVGSAALAHFEGGGSLVPSSALLAAPAVEASLCALQLVLCDALVGVGRTEDALVRLRGLSEHGESSADVGRALVRQGACLHSLSRFIPAYAALKRGCMVLEVALGKYSNEFVRASSAFQQVQTVVSDWLQLTDLWRYDFDNLAVVLGALECAGWSVTSTTPVTHILHLLAGCHWDKLDYQTAESLYGIVGDRLDLGGVGGPSGIALPPPSDDVAAPAAVTLPGGVEVATHAPSLPEARCRQGSCLFRCGKYSAGMELLQAWLPPLVALVGEEHPLCSGSSSDLSKVQAVLNRERRQSWNAVAAAQVAQAMAMDRRV